MLTVAYLANQFPSPVEPYVAAEISELRGRGVRIIAASIRRPLGEGGHCQISPDLVLRNSLTSVLLQAVWLCCRNWRQISDVYWRIVSGGKEGPAQRAKALAHTILGACLAVLLRKRGVDHIHVHHGYFGAWVGLVAARLLNVRFSMTLHGSDLLLHGTYLDLKLENCASCFTVSDFNRQFILRKFPRVASEKILVSRLGVDVPPEPLRTPRVAPGRKHIQILAVGRLHAVKDHAFLLRACAELQAEEIPFECFIAGEGPERCRLELLIHTHRLDKNVRLLGHVPRDRMDALYHSCDLVVLTSRSEGIPLVLMEAMAAEKLVLAPAITGIPELVVDGKTGFLYEAGSMRDFLDRLYVIRSLLTHPRLNGQGQTLDWIRHAARVHVLHNFNRKKNLESFACTFLARMAPPSKSLPHANFVLQQI